MNENELLYNILQEVKTIAASASADDFFASVKTYGAIGDKTIHLLSEKYPSNAAAQADNQIAISGCTFSSGSTAVSCPDCGFLVVGMPISGPGIAAGTTVASITDGLNFVLSANTTAPGSSVSLTSSFVLDYTQDTLDYIGIQQCIWDNGSTFIPAGQYLINRTIFLRSPTGLSQEGIILFGLGPRVSEIVTTVDVNGVRFMEQNCLIRDFSICCLSTDSTGGKSSGVILDSGHPENNPPRYSYGWHTDNILTVGFAQGIYNPYKWDEGDITRGQFKHCGCAVRTNGNLDTLNITNSNSTGLGWVNLTGVTLDTSKNTLTCSSTTNVVPGMLVEATGLTDQATVLSVDSSTQITLSENPSASNTGITATAGSIGLWVDNDGRAKWTKGVLSSNHYFGHASSSNSPILIAEHLHLEGANTMYFHGGVAGEMALNYNFYSDVGITYTASVNIGRLTFDGGTSNSPFAVKQTGRSLVLASGTNTPVVVTDEDGDSYVAAAGWYSAPPYDAPSSSHPFWPIASASNEGMFVGQYVGHTETRRPMLWQCVRVQSTSTFAWQIVDGDYNYTAATLPAAANYTYRGAIVTDSNSTTIGSIVAGGGTNIVHVISDGTNWLIA